jgi:hypothetical protein
MSDTTQTSKMIRRPESSKPDQARQPAREDQGASSGPQSQQDDGSSSGRSIAPGRKPLFRS